MKSILIIQKYPHIIESNACILKIFVVIFLMHRIIYFLSKYVQLQSNKSKLLCHLHTKLSNELLLICTHRDLLHVTHPLF